jgi:predicted transcriptional regulator
VLLIQEEEVRRYEGKRRWWRRGWVTEERRLLEVVQRKLFETPADLSALLPLEMKEPFTTKDLAKATDCRRKLAQKMAYCLRKMGVIEQVGKRKRAYLYARSN